MFKFKNKKNKINKKGAKNKVTEFKNKLLWIKMILN